MFKTRRSEGHERRAQRRAHADYTGGVYGSMLASSVIVGAGALGSFPRLELILLLLATGLVFWIAHVHAELFGERMSHRRMNRDVVMRVCREEWPIFKAAIPPAIAVAVSPLFSLGAQGTVWLALIVAVGGQVGWSLAAAFRSGASTRLVVVSAAVNLVLGILIIVLKVVLTH